MLQGLQRQFRGKTECRVETPRGPVALDCLVAQAPSQLTPLGSYWRSGWQALCWCDGVILGGGSMFHDAVRSPLRRYRGLTKLLLWVLLAKVKGKPVLLLGVGFGPLSSRMGRWLIGAIVSSARAAFWRHPQDVTELNAKGFLGSRQRTLALRCSDLSCYGPDPAVRRAPGSGVLAVNLFPFFRVYGFTHSSPLDRTLVMGLAHALMASWPQGRPTKILLLSLCNKTQESDEDALQCFGEALQSWAPCAFVSYQGVEEVFEHLSKARWALSMRYHGLWAAARMGLPVLPLSYHLKCGQWADAMGLPEWLDWRQGAMASWPKVLGRFFHQPDSFRVDAMKFQPLPWPDLDSWVNLS